MTPNGIRTINCVPFRYGGIMHNYEKDIEEWQKNEGDAPKKDRHFEKCFGCGGRMRNIYSPAGALLKKSYPYMAAFKIQRGIYKGCSRFRVLCRSCAYDYGKGVVEMDGETYTDPYQFNEAKYKKGNYPICGRCEYYRHEDIDDGYVCTNGDSEYVTEWVEKTDSCEHFTRKEIRKNDH